MFLGHPGWLVLLGLIVPVLIWSRHARSVLGPIRGVVVPALRCLLVVFIVLALADPVFTRTSDVLTVAVVVDRSDSMPDAALSRTVDWLQDAMLDRTEDDRLAVVHIGRDAVPGLMPTAHGHVALDATPARTDATDLAAGLELAKGLLPDDGLHRIVLLSDGNETTGSIRTAAQRAAQAGLPLDVLPVVYRRDAEVLVERVVAPSDIRPGQAIDVRVVLRSQGEATGRLALLVNGEPAGADVPLQLEPGTTVVPFTIQPPASAVQHFSAVFEPDPGTPDAVAANNMAQAVAFGHDVGRVLLVSEGETDAQRLAGVLRERGIEVHEGLAGELNTGAAGLASWDAIVLVNVPRWSVTDEADAELAVWVSSGGGGLLMVGGPQSFGAGGWIGSQVETALPVTLDPPADRQLRRGALALIVHSCEMPRGNYWGRKVADAAIESLGAQDWVGILELDPVSGTSVWSLPMEEAGDKVRALAATAALRFGDMQSFEPAMTMALDGLNGVDAGHRHVIIISDGDPAPPSETLLDAYVNSGVTVTTVMVGGHGTPTDRRRMQVVASLTGGRFYDVQDPAALPRIFIREAQLVSRSLVQEGAFQPVLAAPPGGPIAISAESIPGVSGFVLTESRGGLATDALIIPTSQADDPLFSWWHHGVGRAAVFTSDLGARWARQWPSWSEDAPFWERLVRWLMRPGDDGSWDLALREDADGRVQVDLESRDLEFDVSSGVAIQASVLGPGGVTSPLNLRQVGPGRFQGAFDMDRAGAWVVGVGYAGGETRGWTQAAIVRNWPRESGAVSSNEALLAQVARDTQGRVLSVDDDPSLVRIFDRTGLTSSSGHRQAWGLLAVLAAVTLLLDVLVRRLVPDQQRKEAIRRQARNAAQAAPERVTQAWARIRRQQASIDRGEAAPPTPVVRSDGGAASGPQDPEDTSEDQDTLSRLKAARRGRDEDAP